MANALPATPPVSTVQFGRMITLIVSPKNGEKALDLSELRIKFTIKRSDTMTPNVADIRVYNLDLQIAATIKKEFTKVVLQAGYLSNFGVIFQGNIKQVILGRENSTDTYMDIIAGDGDRAYNFAIVKTTLAKGSSTADHLKAATLPMADHGVTKGYTGTLPPNKLSRGKVMYGNARDHIKSLADSAGLGWTIENEQINVIPKTTYLPGERVILTSKTGLIGTPQQTDVGVNCKCLINPKLKINGQIQIDNAAVENLKINLSVPGSASNIPAPLSEDGVYSLLVIEHSGDTRGQEWYSSLVAINNDIQSNPRNAIPFGVVS